MHATEYWQPDVTYQHSTRSLQHVLRHRMYMSYTCILTCFKHLVHSNYSSSASPDHQCPCYAPLAHELSKLPGPVPPPHRRAHASSCKRFLATPPVAPAESIGWYELVRCRDGPTGRGGCQVYRADAASAAQQCVGSVRRRGLAEHATLTRLVLPCRPPSSGEACRSSAAPYEMHWRHDARWPAIWLDCTSS